MADICGFVAESGAVLTLIGGAPNLSMAEFETLPFPLLAALVRAESREQAATGLAAAARDATRRATTLAAALDLARAELTAQAAELASALADAARLNRELQALNDTLEERVAERTEALKKETEERIKAETALLQSQKMEAVGQLTGGVAHDFNNILSVMIGTLDSIQRLGISNPRLRHLVELAERAAKRGEVLTQQLLAFSRRQLLRPQRVDLNSLIANYRELLRRALGETIRLDIRLCAIPCYCHIDPVQFETAILNLTVNARDAMPAGGTLTIETAICAGNTVEDRRQVGSGSYACVTVTDSGTGIDTAIVTRVFDPFFTTKPVGKGTGLGLSQVHGFVHQSGGRIEIDSAPDKGTRVRLYLPLISGENAKPEHTSHEDIIPQTGAETILIVEDDPDVTEMILASLESLGYRVLHAGNGREALAVLQRNKQVDLLFTDLVMPGGMSGTQLIAAARQIRPQLKVLLTSGYAAHPAAVTDDGLREELPLISKPYQLRDLAAAIRAVLAGSSTLPRPREPAMQ